MTRPREVALSWSVLALTGMMGVLSVLRGPAPWLSVLVLSTCVTLTVAAFLLRRDKEQERSGLLLYAAAACLALSDVGSALGTLGELIARITTWWAVLPLGVVLLTYPGQRVTRPWHRLLLIAAGADFVVLWAVEQLFRQLSSSAGQGLHAPISRAFSIGGVMVSLLACAALVQRWRTAAEPERKAVRSVTFVGLALASTFAFRLLVLAVADTGMVLASIYEVARFVNLACLGLAPVGLLFEALRRRAAHGTMIESLLDAGIDATRIQAAMAHALSDQSVRLAFPLDGRGSMLIDVSGSESDIGPDRPGRILRELRSAQGIPIAVVDADESTTRDPAQLRLVLAGAALTLDNARLHARLMQSLEEVRQSRTRIVEATVQSRRRIERDLHDGPQQQLLAVAATLARAEIVVTPEERARALSDARTQLSNALVELRRLARGIHPALLSQGGLPAALPTLADSASVPVEIDVPSDLKSIRFSARVETTLWFVAAEAMTNAVKHSGANRICLRLRTGAGHTIVSIEDNGRGGARLLAGGGLAGLSDRVSALGGTLCVTSSATAGTRVEASLPCES